MCSATGTQSEEIRKTVAAVVLDKALEPRRIFAYTEKLFLQQELLFLLM